MTNNHPFFGEESSDRKAPRQGSNYAVPEEMKASQPHDDNGQITLELFAEIVDVLVGGNTLEGVTDVLAVLSQILAKLCPCDYDPSSFPQSRTLGNPLILRRSGNALSFRIIPA